MDNSPLGRLAAELLNTIYELVLTSPDSIKLVPNKDHNSLEATSGTWATRLALTRACRQIRNQTLPIFYGTNAFHIIGQDEEENLHLVAKDWTNKLGPCADMIRGVNITSDVWGMTRWAKDFFRDTVGIYPPLSKHPKAQIQMSFYRLSFTSETPNHFSLNLTTPNADLIELAFEDLIEDLKEQYGYDEMRQDLEADEEEMREFVALLREWMKKRSMTHQSR